MDLQRVRWDQVSPQRIAGAVKRRIGNLPHALAWRLSQQAAVNRQRLAAYHNRHRGERCIIMANGPSLKQTDFALIENEVTFGMNRIYLLFDHMGFEPTYFTSSNGLVISQFAEDIRQLNMPTFLNWNYRRYFDPSNENRLFFKTKFGLGDAFDGDLTQPISDGGTVTYVTLQLAYYMGFKTVLLIGLDHSFAEKGVPNTVAVRQQERDASHFSPDYFEKGVRWQYPDLLRSELAYALAREAFERDGRRIIDATDGGQCDVFRKAALRDVL